MLIDVKEESQLYYLFPMLSLLHQICKISASQKGSDAHFKTE